MSAKQVSKQYIIRSLSEWGHSEDSTKHSHKQQLLDIQQLKDKSQIAPQLPVSSHPSNQMMRVGGKEIKKGENENRP